MTRSTRRGSLLAAALAIAAFTGVGSASAATVTYTVPLSAATQDATHVAGDPGGTGSSQITMNDSTNTVCATTTWSGIDTPVVWAHIHAGRYGEPEDPAVSISLFDPDFLNGRASGASGCTLVAPGEILAIARCPAFFNVVVHSQGKPAGAIRGQFSTVGLLPRPCTNIPPNPGPAVG